jgi:ribulose-bisphosphate carboxylase large chain
MASKKKAGAGARTHGPGDRPVSPRRIVARYLVETPMEVERAAAVLAGEQSSGTFVAVPGETAALRRRFEARVERVVALEGARTPSLPGCRASGKSFNRAEVTVSWSVENMGYNLPTLVSTLQGNLYELSQFSGLRLLDLEVPESFAAHFPGPRFGIAGTYGMAGVPGRGRPLIGTIIKPSIGLSPAQTAKLVGRLVSAGIDFIKDDELMADPPHSRFNDRVDAVMRVINAHADRTGRKAMYAFNISDEMDAMLGHYDKVVAAGGTCAMVSLNTVGLSGVKRICDRGVLPIHGHRNGWGMLTRHPLLGVGFAAYQKIWRLAGVDQIHVNGIANKFWEPDAMVVASIEACLKPMLGGYSILPVVSSGQWGGQAFETYRLTGTTDLLYLAGGGIMAHPGGPSGGVRAICDAWKYAVSGLTLAQAAAHSPELAQSIEKFGRKS